MLDITEDSKRTKLSFKVMKQANDSLKKQVGIVIILGYSAYYLEFIYSYSSYTFIYFLYICALDLCL